MPLNPTASLLARSGTSTEVRILSRLADVERRLRTVEQAQPRIQVTSGTPTGTAREGTPVIDRTGIGFGPRVGFYIAASPTRYWWVNLG